MACIELHLWGSSHFAERSTFTPSLDEVLNILGRFAAPINHSRGGARIRDSTLADFRSTLMEAYNRPQIHVLLLGDNNFRRIPTPHEQVFVVSDLIQGMADRLEFNPQAQLLVLGLMPCPERFDFFWPLFQSVNENLQRLARIHPRVHFCATNFLLETPSWERSLFRDGVHLNSYGNRLLVRHVFTAIRLIVIHHF